MNNDDVFIAETFDLAVQSIEGGNRPFAAIIVLHEEIVIRMTDLVTQLNDPTAHPEIMAIRQFCQDYRPEQLRKAVIYSIVEPCPMCAGAIYYSGMSRLVYSISRVKFDNLVSRQRKRLSKNYQSCRPIITDQGLTRVTGPILEDKGMDIIRQYSFARQEDEAKRLILEVSQ